MAVVVPVDDPSDERVADYVGLTDPDLRRRRERPGAGGGAGGGAGDGAGDGAGGFFIAEGLPVIRHLLRSPYRVRSLLLTSRRLHALSGELDGVDAPVYVGSQEVVNAVTGFHLHRGAVASAHREALPDPVELAAGTDLVVVAEGVNDHENLGALFRNAAAFGAGAVLLDPTSADPLYRRSVRVSMGHVLRVPFSRAPRWPAVLADLRDLGFEIVALTPSPGAEDLAALAPGRRRALLVGTEGPGLTEGALAAADRRVRIPMAPGVDSLNVATAAAVALYGSTVRK